MTTSPRDLAARHYEAGEFRRVAEQLTGTKKLTLDERLLLADAWMHLGRIDEALEVANDLCRHDDGLVAARALTIRADIVGAIGSVDEALADFRAAIERATSENSSEVSCWARLRMFGCLVGNGSQLPAVELFDLLKRDLLRVGKPRLLAAFHVLANEYEAARGNLSQASGHAVLAQAHLKSSPNLWLEGVLMLGQSAKVFLDCNLDQAIDFAGRAAELAESSGDAWLKSAAGAALGYMHLLSGNTENARIHLHKTLYLSERYPVMRFCVLHSLAELALYQHDLDECHVILTELQRIAEARQQFQDSWYMLNVLRTRIKLAMIQHRWDDAEEFANTGAALAVRRTDSVMGALYTTSLAEIAVVRGDFERASTLLASASEAILFPPPIVQIEIDRALAALSRAVGNHTEADLALTRALDGARASGNSVVENEIVATSRADALSAHPPEINGPDVDIDGTSVVASWLDAMEQPQVLGERVLAYLKRQACLSRFGLIRLHSGHADVMECSGWTPARAKLCLEQPETESHVRLALGAASSGDYVLLLVPLSDLPARRRIIAVRKLLQAVSSLRRVRVEERERESIWSDRDFQVASGAITFSPPMVSLLRGARRVAATNVPVLLTGETGVGKEVVARLIHDTSQRSGKPFIPFNCGAVPREMLESQLFGYRRGAFTGAQDSFSGIIRAANGGTVFLDEIGDVPPDVQPKLLRFLETGEVHPLGESVPIRVDVRILAATNRPLKTAVISGSFREDLYYRLNVVQFEIPPLRARREEIPGLANQFLRRYADEFDRGALALTAESIEYLATYSWPGNVRQLLNEMRRVAALAETDSSITPFMLSAEVTANRRVSPEPKPSEPAIGVRLDQTLPVAIAAVEQALIQYSLSRTQGRMEDAAKLLGISRKGLFLKRRRYGITETRES